MANGSDIVIVGAGSAGCVLAARLSEDPHCRVTLIEAGGDADSSVVRQPSQWPLLWDREQNWGYSTTVQSGYALRSILCQRGKGPNPGNPGEGDRVFVQCLLGCQRQCRNAEGRDSRLSSCGCPAPPRPRDGVRAQARGMPGHFG
jgi:hypothetical protein